MIMKCTGKNGSKVVHLYVSRSRFAVYSAGWANFPTELKDEVEHGC